MLPYIYKIYIYITFKHYNTKPKKKKKKSLVHAQSTCDESNSFDKIIKMAFSFSFFGDG